jgi:hypothetical protein
MPEMTVSPSWQLLAENKKLRDTIQKVVDHNKTMGEHIKHLNEELAGGQLVLYVMLRRFCEGEARISMQEIIDSTGGKIQRSFAPDADEKKGCYIFTALPPEKDDEVVAAMSPEQFEEAAKERAKTE